MCEKHTDTREQLLGVSLDVRLLLNKALQCGLLHSAMETASSGKNINAGP